MHTVEYHCWNPPSSPLRVEIPSLLLLDLGWADSTGLLYGSRCGNRVRIESLSAPEGEEQEKVGVFVSRIRGDVFLTEDDLAFFNQQSADLALVVAGDCGGFFVREPDGSVQTVQSHQEFSIPGPTPAPPLEFPALPPVPVPPVRRVKWLPLPVTVSAIFLVAVLGLWGASRPKPAVSQDLEIRASGGELHISWRPSGQAVLVIRDAGRNVSVPIYADQASATYTPHSPDVEVTLLRMGAKNQWQRESTRYIAGAAPPGAGPSGAGSLRVGPKPER